MPILGLQPDEDESAAIREFFESHTDTERRRLYNLFKSMMESPGQYQEKDWSDSTPDGSLKVPGITRAAKNGK